MESPHRHPLLLIQGRYRLYGPQSWLATSDLRNALVVQMEPQNQLDIKHHLHPEVTSLFMTITPNDISYNG